MSLSALLFLGLCQKGRCNSPLEGVLHSSSLVHPRKLPSSLIFPFLNHTALNCILSSEAHLNPSPTHPHSPFEQKISDLQCRKYRFYLRGSLGLTSWFPCHVDRVLVTVSSLSSSLQCQQPHPAVTASLLSPLQPGQSLSLSGWSVSIFPWLFPVLQFSSKETGAGVPLVPSPPCCSCLGSLL